MFQTISQTAMFHWVGLLATLLFINELSRSSKWFSVLFYFVIPIPLTFLVWIHTGTDPANTDINTWFHWVKLYSVLIAVVGFTLMRFTSLGENKWMKFFPAFILFINILEAVLRDFELGAAGGGIFHWMNGIAGVFSAITLCGMSGVFIDTKHKRDLLWPDMTLFWIIAYDVWNFTYIYNCVPEHAFYGLAVLLACTIPAVFIKKGTWVQARALTLAAWMMYIFTFPGVVTSAASRVDAVDSTGPNMALSALSLLLNGAFFVYHFWRVYTQRKFTLGDEIYSDTAGFKKIAQFRAAS
jgi:hypothetical protein